MPCVFEDQVLAILVLDCTRAGIAASHARAASAREVGSQSVRRALARFPDRPPLSSPLRSTLPALRRDRLGGEVCGPSAVARGAVGWRGGSWGGAGAVGNRGRSTRVRPSLGELSTGLHRGP